MTVFVHSLRATSWHVLPSGGAGITVRPVSDDDFPALQRLVMACRGPVGFGKRLSAGVFRPLLARGGRRVRVWLAETEDARVVAAAGLAASPHDGRIRWSIPALLVSPGARRRGVATALVRALLQAAREGGAGVVMAETLTTWIDAHAFWSRIAVSLDSADRGFADTVTQVP